MSTGIFGCASSEQRAAARRRIAAVGARVLRQRTGADAVRGEVIGVLERRARARDARRPSNPTCRCASARCCSAPVVSSSAANITGTSMSGSQLPCEPLATGESTMKPPRFGDARPVVAHLHARPAVAAPGCPRSVHASSSGHARPGEIVRAADADKADATAEARSRDRRASRSPGYGPPLPFDGSCGIGPPASKPAAKTTSPSPHIQLRQRHGRRRCRRARGRKAAREGSHRGARTWRDSGAPPDERTVSGVAARKAVPRAAPQQNAAAQDGWRDRTNS